MDVDSVSFLANVVSVMMSKAGPSRPMTHSQLWQNTLNPLLDEAQVVEQQYDAFLESISMLINDTHIPCACVMVRGGLVKL